MYQLHTVMKIYAVLIGKVSGQSFSNNGINKYYEGKFLFINCYIRMQRKLFTTHFHICISHVLTCFPGLPAGSFLPLLVPYSASMWHGLNCPLYFLLPLGSLSFLFYTSTPAYKHTHKYIYLGSCKLKRTFNLGFVDKRTHGIVFLSVAYFI